MTDIEKLLLDAKAIHKQVEDELNRRFPKGTRLLVMLRRGQTNPTPVTVSHDHAADGYGMVRVRLDNGRTHRGNPIQRDFYYTSFMCNPDAE
jgi:hypothetical protein